MKKHDLVGILLVVVLVVVVVVVIIVMILVPILKLVLVAIVLPGAPGRHPAKKQWRPQAPAARA